MTIATQKSIPVFDLNDGTKIPSLAWGNGSGKAKKAPAELTLAAFRAGIQHIDTAQGYNNEQDTGDALKHADATTVYLTTKVSTKDGDPTNPPIPTSQIRTGVLESIAKLGRQPNLLLIHNPFVPAKGELLNVWRVLEDMKDKGELSASLGVSNFGVSELDLLVKEAKYPPTVHQLEYHPLVLVQLEEILAFHKKHNIVTSAYGPLTPIIRCPLEGNPLIPVLNKIAARLSSNSGQTIDIASVLLLWVRAQGVVTITTSGTPENIQKLAAVQFLPDLTSEEAEEITTVGKTAHFRNYDEHMRFLAEPKFEQLDMRAGPIV